MLRIGIDLGGTKTEILALDDRGATLLRRRTQTPTGNYEATVQHIARLVGAAERELNQTGTVGIGTPGAISPASGCLRNSNSTCLNGKPLKQDLERLLERPVHLSNDANCFVLSEALDGAAAGARIAFGVILGTGVGGGIAVHGRALEGVNAIAGEWGHNPLPWPEDSERPGPLCYCGKRGCIETWLSGPGLERDHERYSGERLTATAIAQHAETGDGAAHASLVRYEHRLARSLATVINVLDPDVIVLGGGLSNIARLYHNVPAQWGQWIFSDVVNTRLERNRHGDSSGVRGAAFIGAATKNTHP
ncbi:MAG TPA: ROK family protein [Burkholderiales bacterium]|nr:ROK family protein [Burkholderiales bacterium]